MAEQTERQTTKHRARKRFGQNFLVDETIIDSIVDLVEEQMSGATGKTNALIEIGPGLGAITQPLLKRFNSLTAIEIDRDLAARLRNRFAAHPGFSLIETDALTVNLEALGSDQPGQQFTIVGNLPYNISTPLLFHLFTQADRIESMLFMLQKEVVQRMVAQPGTKTFGKLSVMTQYHCHVESLLEIGPESFDPPPKIDSQLIRLVPRREALLSPPAAEQLRQIVTAAFAQRRKTLRNTLAGICDQELIIAAGCDPGARAERLTLQQFLQLATRVTERLRSTAEA